MRHWILSLAVASGCGGTASQGETDEGSSEGSTSLPPPTSSTSSSSAASTSTATTAIDSSSSSSSESTAGPSCVDQDADGYGENCNGGPDCDDTNANVWTDPGCVMCSDADGDGYWAGCDAYDDDAPGPDCDDGNDNAWTPEACDGCVDMDADGSWVGCDAYDDDTPGPDCNDADPHVWTEAGCSDCTDGDMDGVYLACDAYDDDQPGPDCDDDNPIVGTESITELCDGLSQNCAGEIDPGMPDELCPPSGVDAPNVDTWVCQPPSPGEDGCGIATCSNNAYDLDGLVEGGCECLGTSRTESLAACSDAPQGFLGTVLEGQQLAALPVGTIPLIDNGLGAGAEDWYSVEFPELGATGTRPNAGIIQVSFAQNTGNDYRFEVYRSCGSIAFSNGLATSFGAAAPPLREWWFFDNHQAPAQMDTPEQYTDNVAWPETVYIRVFRVQNSNTCNTYQLAIQRTTN